MSTIYFKFLHEGFGRIQKTGLCQETPLKSMEYVPALAEEHKAEIRHGCDSAQFETPVKSTEGYYE
jgi:hypothetical protein